MPELDPEITEDYFQILAEEGTDVNDYYDGLLENIREHDSEFSKALEEFLQREDQQLPTERRHIFVLGAIATYDMLKHQFMTLDLRAGWANVPVCEKPPEDSQAA